MALSALVILAMVQKAAAAGCEVPGDPDLLGIGVRLGFYFQFASNILLIFKRPDEAASSIIVSSMLMSGYFIATIYSITQNNLAPGAIIPAIWFFVLDGSAKGAISLVTRAGGKALSFWNKAFFHLRFCALAGFYLWFWFHGLYVPHPAQCMEPRVWVVVNGGAYGAVRICFKVLSVILGVFSVLGIIGILHDFLKRFNESGSWAHRMSLKPCIQENDDVDETDVVWMAILVIVQGILPMLVAIIGVELEIRWNHLIGVQTISSTGQVFPLVVGGFSLFRSIALMLIDISESWTVSSATAA
jgi:hypothetical protein